MVSQLLFLKLPDIELLVSIWVDLDSIGYINPLLECSTSVHIVNCLFVDVYEVRCWLSLSIPQTLLKQSILAVSVWISFDFLLFLLLVIIFISLLVGVSRAFERDSCIRDCICFSLCLGELTVLIRDTSSCHVTFVHGTAAGSLSPPLFETI